MDQGGFSGIQLNIFDEIAGMTAVKTPQCPTDDMPALVIIASEKSGFMGVLFATKRKDAMTFCTFTQTEGRGKYGGRWACFFVTQDIDEYELFINDDGRFDPLIKEHGLEIIFRVFKKGGGTTKVKKWREKVNR